MVTKVVILIKMVSSIMLLFTSFWQGNYWGLVGMVGGHNGEEIWVKGRNFWNMNGIGSVKYEIGGADASLSS